MLAESEHATRVALQNEIDVLLPRLAQLHIVIELRRTTGPSQGLDFRPLPQPGAISAIELTPKIGRHIPRKPSARSALIRPGDQVAGVWRYLRASILPLEIRGCSAAQKRESGFPSDKARWRLALPMHVGEATADIDIEVGAALRSAGPETTQ